MPRIRKRQQRRETETAIAILVNNQAALLARVAAMDERLAELKERLLQVETDTSRDFRDYERQLGELKCALIGLPDSFCFESIEQRLKSLAAGR